LWVVDRAWSDNDEEAAETVDSVDYGDRFVATLHNGVDRGLRLADFVLEEIGRGQRSHASNTPVFDAFAVADCWVGHEELEEVSMHCD
jgi:hypothetical protein